jgi:hypothetical protein
VSERQSDYSLPGTSLLQPLTRLEGVILSVLSPTFPLESITLVRILGSRPTKISDCCFWKIEKLAAWGSVRSLSELLVDAPRPPLETKRLDGQ